MKTLSIAALTLALLGPPPAAYAQTAPDLAYPGPYFPGGPDSLRAFVYRATRQGAGPTVTGQVALTFKLENGQKPSDFKLLSPPEKLSPALAKAGRSAAAYLSSRMPDWQPPLPDPDAPARTSNPSVTLLLDFSRPLADQPYYYADQEAQFDISLPPVRMRAGAVPPPAPRHARNQMHQYLQRQIKYPVAALRSGLSGVVVAYFEVSPSGEVESRQIIGSANKVLDAEVTRVLAELPAAPAPARLRDQPVRQYFTVPFTFSIQ